MTSQPIDLLTLIADDKSLVSYRPRWNQITGSMAATILLQQIIYRWMQNGRQPFYKFTRPCDHILCRPGDTWTEELGMTRHEFETARGRIAARTHGDITPDACISYWTTSGHLTWYAINEPLLVEQLSALYPIEPAAVGIQTRIPTTEPFPKSGNGNAEPFPQFGNANAEFQQQVYRDDLIDSSEQRSPETTAPTPAADPKATPVAPPPAVDAAAGSVLPAADLPPPADPTPAILRWIGFQDKLGQKDRAGDLDPPSLLAWAYWIHLESNKPTRPKNAVALARSQWQKGLRPRDDLLALARGWLALDDDGRRALLEGCDYSARYDFDDPAFDDDFPGLPIAAAIAVYRATAGELAPPALTPTREATAAVITAARANLHGPVAAASRLSQARAAPPTSGIWCDALAELEMQMTRATFSAWLQGTTADETPAGLTVHTRNAEAVEWLSHRLHPVIQRAVDSLAGRPMAVRYEVAPQPEAQP